MVLASSYRDGVLAGNGRVGVALLGQGMDLLQPLYFPDLALTAPCQGGMGSQIGGHRRQHSGKG